MISIFLRVFFATGVFAVLHSLLATREVKRRAEQRFGQRNRAGLYRFLFNGQSVISMAALLAYFVRLPDRELYQVRGWPVILLRLGQAAALVFATIAAWQVGLGRITGLTPLAAWLRGDRHIDPEPEAQGPASAAQDLSGALRDEGPFRVSRHPLNLAPLPVFWLTPRMTVKRLAFNIAGSLYLVLGSLHEESRLREAYGERYHRYQNSGVRFYL